MPLALIQIKDICYYDNDFEYEPFLVEQDENFDEKYRRLVHICQNYDDFQEVEDFIEDNFTKVKFEKLIIEI